MKLRMKMTAVSAAVILMVLGAGLTVFSAVQEAALRRTDENNARKALSLYCMNVVSVVNADTSQIQAVTLRSVVDYYFAAYAHMLQDGLTYYSLCQDGRYLFNTCPYDPAAVYGGTQIPPINTVSDGQAEITVLRIPIKAGSALVGACSLSISGQAFDVYICMDVSETDARISGMRWLSVLILCLSCVGVSALTALFMGFVLRPVRELTRTAVRIAGGDYHRRTALRAGDEIGQLSVAFDRMADSIEEKIGSLDAQLHKKQLLLGALAHEIKTPMTAIIGYSDSLLHMPLSGEQRTACTRRILDAGRHTEALCRKLMELISLSENEHIERKRFPARRLAQALRETGRPGVDIACEDFDLCGDETLLFSMAGNLIDNAVKASPEGAAVHVVIAGGPGKATLTVTDAGRGIPAESIALVTEPFYRVDKARSRKDGGAGLGLALCRLIAERHGGGIAIESRPGQGTRVTVTLSQLDDISPTT